MAKMLFRMAPVCVVLGTMTIALPAKADGALIWAPVKVAPRVYQTTVGVKLPLAVDASAGADLGLSTGTGGQLLSGSELATVWGKVADSRQRLGTTEDRAVVVRIDTLGGSGGVSLSRSRSWIYSSNLDLKASNSLNLNYAAAAGVSPSIDATQALTMTYPWAGTAVSASGTVTSATGDITGTLALNQPLAPHLRFTASVADPLSATRAGDLRMNYRIKW
ncbi:MULTISPECIES: hypothetical protein [unclassified Rhizobium]|uniref:hypothetical protein n=1 Tax=unclassified Rhizobium TaxID=2613769 RepID=UPI001ADCE5C8|nr:MULTISPECIES: hypothetical protein [unclassified Rhizobium]MBO9100092.1 hypothetical protein [Rhizobium sp. L58/93]MBO9135751.1 hypothetical protein [Rhizobium sp. B209b/85]MBO9170058.1 hypothetical protein [Rhizobium sp. L245/93]MBO9185985.1 hypothetical protein [Rhizobium sp. E27B/91]QXZ82918.1 hypothetical protein J5287_12620 [Rhizobium sp. K1/93]